MPVPNIFGSATSAIPLSQLDQNFATAITLGNTAVYLGNTTTSLGNVTLTNVTISSGNVSVSTATVGAGSNTAPSITTTGDTNTGIFFPAADTIAFSEGGAEAMRLDSAGNMGLGVTPSAWNSAYKAFQLNTQPAIWGSSDTLFLSVNQFQNSSGSNRYIANGFATQYRQDAGTHQWYNAASGTAGNAISFTQAMTLDASGNLLVGLTSSSFSDTKNLQVAGWIAPRSTTVPSGGIGGSTLFAKERVYFGDNTGWTWDWYTVNTSGTTFRRFYFTDAGAAYNATGTWGSISDAKLKENIVDATPKLAGLMQVKVRNYNLIGETTKQIGVVAQELETIFPAMVENTVDKDAEGNELGTTTKAVKYSVFVPMLIKALQEQQAIIQTLTDRITALEQA